MGFKMGNCKLLFAVALCISVGVVSVSSYVVTWTGDDEVKPHTSRPLLGQRECTQGPAYWCHNITQAKQCNAVRHCISKVWEGMKLPEDNDNVCQICKDMVAQARDQLLSNETQTELREVLEGSCNLLPLKIVRKECIELADEFIPELVDALASRMDPQVVCAVSGLCNSLRIDEMLGEMKPLQPAKHKEFDIHVDSCPKCNHYIGKSITFLKSLPESALMQKLFMICGRLGSYSDSCSYLVEQYIENIHSEIQNRFESKELCTLVGLCDVTTVHRVNIGAGSTAIRVWSPQKDDDLPCDFCKQLVTHVKEWLGTNTTREEFRDMVIGICKQTGKFRQECLNLARQYGKALYQLLVDEADPDRMCGMIGVCPNTSKFQLFEYQETQSDSDDIVVVDAKRLVPAERLSGDDELVVPQAGDNISDRFDSNDETAQGVKGKAECQFCEYAMHELQVYLSSSRTEKEIEDGLDQLCDRLLPPEMAKECTNFVDTYSKSIIAILQQEIDPSQVCPMLGACPSINEVGNEIARIPVVRKNYVPKSADLPTCPLCHYAVHEVISLIGKNRTKEAVDEALDSVCYVLPKTIKSDCLNFMTYYGNRIGEMIVIEMSSREICMALGLCILFDQPTTTPASKIIVTDPLPLSRYMPSVIISSEIAATKLEHPELFDSRSSEESLHGPGQECVVCEFVINQITQRLENNATEDEIRNVVENACDYLPKTIRAQCKDFVDAYSEMVINYLAQSLDPKQVCTELGLCKPQHILQTTTIASEMNLDMGRCQLCVLISDYLSAMLEDPKVETSVDKIMEKICPVLPQKYRQECKSMIEEYGPYLLSLLAQGADKGKACSILSMCPGKEAQE